MFGMRLAVDCGCCSERFLKGRQDGCKNHQVAPLLYMQSVESHLDNGSAESDGQTVCDGVLTWRVVHAVDGQENYGCTVTGGFNATCRSVFLHIYTVFANCIYCFCAFVNSRPAINP